MNLLYIIIVMICIIALIVLIWGIVTSNRLKTTNIKIDEALSGIDVALTKRYDVITNMVEVVKGYAKHEKETLFAVVELRKEMSLSEKSQANKKMDENLQKINVLVENYPELKASKNFMELQKAIVDVEEHLQASRRCYNANVSVYNSLVLTFPSNIIAKNSGMKEREFFQAEESKRENVQVKLD